MLQMHRLRPSEREVSNRFHAFPSHLNSLRKPENTHLPAQTIQLSPLDAPINLKLDFSSCCDHELHMKHRFLSVHVCRSLDGPRHQPIGYGSIEGAYRRLAGPCVSANLLRHRLLVTCLCLGRMFAERQFMYINRTRTRLVNMAYDSCVACCRL
jgi:hypothetical protein